MTNADGSPPANLDIDAVCRVLTVCVLARDDAVDVGGDAVAILLAAGLSYRDMRERTGVSLATAGRWLDNHNRKHDEGGAA